MLFFKIGAAVGWIIKDRAKAPATLEKSESNILYYEKTMLPYTILLTKLTKTNTK